ncbi:MAG: hypothetical protein Q7T80_14530 [Methanoregula sp.]|nr:hypothetical protein [Methanoregula sp.]
MSAVCAGFFFASGKPVLYLIQSTIINSRFLFLLIFIPFGVMGIFSSLIIASAISVLFAICVLYHYGVRFQLPKKKFLIDTFHYSISNYFSDCFLAAPVFIIPVMIFLIEGEKDTALYSVSYAVASVTFLIPTAIGYALFMSGCQKKITIQSMKMKICAIMSLLVVIIILFSLLGKNLVNLLGPDYSGTENLIVIIMISSIFALFFQVFSAEFKIFRQVRKLLLLNFVFFVTIMSMSYFLIVNKGLNGAGYAWIAAYAICVIPLICYRLFNKKHIFSNEISS